MTNKPIIIDDVNVSGCEWIREVGLDSEYICTCNSPNKTSGYCKYNPNCCYKQLKRKEQECNELKNHRDQWISRCEQETKLKEFHQNEPNQLEVERDFLSKQSKTLIDALLHIKELANQKLELCKDNKKNCTNCEYTCKENMILEKISEVLDEEV